MASAAVDKGADELRREIDELHRQQREITERLRDPRGLRKGGFAGGARSSVSCLLRPGGRGGFQRGSLRRVNVGDADGQPPFKRRLLSAVVKVDDSGESAEPVDAQNGEEQVKDAQSKEEGDHRPAGAAVHPGRRDTRRGDRGFKEPEDLIVEPQPRILPTVDDPNLAKRNRRMFGALLGTLEKFRQEDQKMSGSEAYLRRSDSLRRAEQKAHEASERLRQQEREQLAEKRKTDLLLRAQLAAKTEEKQLELLFIQWSEHHTKLSPFLRTKAEPGIFYRPAKASDETDKLLENREKEFTEWRIKRRQELTEYQLQVAAAHISHVEAEIEKWQSRMQGRMSGDEADMELGMELANGPKRFGLRISKSVEDEDQDKADDDGDDELEVLDDDAHRKTGDEPGVLTGVLGYGNPEEEVKDS